MKPTILLVEDEDKLRRVVELQLRSQGHEVIGVAQAEAALPYLDRVALVITDLRLPGMDGLGLLGEIRARHPQLPVVVMTAFSSVETAVEAMKRGAMDFVPKPCSMEHLEAVVTKALEVSALRSENRELREQLGLRYSLDNLVASSPAMQEVVATVLRVAPTRATVLLCGESGVGKDLIARAIHQNSPRRDKPFVKINCTAIPENLMESELFGYERGAFTGAISAKAGKFEYADAGTVMLDEIGDVPANIQVKLLRILQEKEFERLGSNKTHSIDVRVIAATNADLRAALEEGRFREDLYYRLNVVPINIPPLRERREDIPEMARRIAARQGRALNEEAIAKLAGYHWPGNVRELENVLERSIVMATGGQLGPSEIRLEPRPQANGAVTGFLPEGMTLEAYEQHLIREALKRAGGNKSQAARLLGLTRNALRYRLDQMGIGEG
jgi:DNA-binding NtrC family response regulator